jgi:hypothetical protein
MQRKSPLNPNAATFMPAEDGAEIHEVRQPSPQVQPPPPEIQSHITRLNNAHTLPEIWAAYGEANGYAFLFALHSQPEHLALLYDALKKTYERGVRLRIIYASPQTPIPFKRIPEHNERTQFLWGAHFAGKDNEMVKKMSSTTCKLHQCKACGTGMHRATCMQFLIMCIAMRLKTRLVFDQMNNYKIHKSIVDFMTEYVDNPIKVWLTTPEKLYALSTDLENMYQTVVEPTKNDSPNASREVEQYRGHLSALQEMISSLRRCHQAAIATGT